VVVPGVLDPPPNTQVPPIAQVHVLPEHVQSPVQVAVVSAASLFEPQATNARRTRSARTAEKAFIVGLVGASGPDSESNGEVGPFAT
jgi:hypothetical protein